MRLELEQIASAFAPIDKHIAFHPINPGSNFDKILADGISAAQSGNRAQARILLQYAVELDKNSEAGWLWLASISEYPEELLVFLDHVLKINPKNSRAGEWKTATNQLMAKTFVQRGIDASKDGRNDYAMECFDRALSFDEQNQLAWFWKDSLSKDDLVEPARESQPPVEKNDASRSVHTILIEAEASLAAGDRDETAALVDEALALDQDSEKAWSLKSQLVDDFEEKRRSLERVVEINPENQTAKAAMETLLAMVEPVVPTFEEKKEPAAERLLNTPFDQVAQPVLSSHENSPTQELELPQAILDHNPFVTDETSAVQNQMFAEPEAEMRPDENIHETESPSFAAVSPAEVEPDEVSHVNSSQDEPEIAAVPVQHFENYHTSDVETSVFETYAEPLQEPKVHEVSASAYLEEADDGVEVSYADESFSDGPSWTEPAETQTYEVDGTATWVIDASDALPENEPDVDPGRTILVVDDSPVVRKLIAGKLQESGYNVLSAASGVEAMQVISNSRPDLVLLDIAMPKMDGYQVCENIRKNGATKDIPVVLISGKDGYYDENRAQMAGTSSFISKPFGPETLMKALETYLPSA